MNNNANHVREFFDDIGSVWNVAVGSTRQSRVEIENFFIGAETRIRKAKGVQRCLDQREATGFNVFALIQPDENCLSDILFDLLDPKGTHGQNEVFLQLFIEKLELTVAVNFKGTAVRREAPTYHNIRHCRRIDILVDTGVLIAIENKLKSGEQPSQVPDYLEHLRRTGKKFVLVYLTPDCRDPEFENLRKLKSAKEKGVLKCWSYQTQLRAWLEECRGKCKAPKIRYFLSNFISYIDSNIQRKPLSSPDDSDET